MKIAKISLYVSLLLVAACSGGGDSDPPAPLPPTDRFASVDTAMLAAYSAQGISGMGLSVYDRNGVKVFERMYGSFSANQRVAIASASKMVSGVVLFSLINKGYLTLDSTTEQVLGWSGANAAITLRQLLSFTSGLIPNNLCTSNATITLATCVDAIAQGALVAAPGARFDYGSTHLHVAARMAEVATGNSWNAILATELLQPLGLPTDIRYYTYPVQILGQINPLVAGGLRTTMNEYARVLQLVFDKGRWQGSALLPSALFDQQAIEPYPNAVIGNSPVQAIGLNFHYGLTAWLECATPQTGCTSVSSPGAFGFTPWVDRTANYYAILGMELTNNQTGVVNFAVHLEQQLKPLIANAISQ